MYIIITVLKPLPWRLAFDWVQLNYIAFDCKVFDSNLSLTDFNEALDEVVCFHDSVNRA